MNTCPAHFIKPEGKIPPDWSTFLLSDENKASLAHCYTQVMMKEAGEYLNYDQELYISGGLGDKVMKVTKHGVEEADALKSNQEESDTRIILHCIFASRICEAQSVLVISDDTESFGSSVAS